MQVPVGSYQRIKQLLDMVFLFGYFLFFSPPFLRVQLNVIVICFKGALLKFSFPFSPFLLLDELYMFPFSGRSSSLFKRMFDIFSFTNKTFGLIC